MLTRNRIRMANARKKAKAEEEKQRKKGIMLTCDAARKRQERDDETE